MKKVILGFVCCAFVVSSGISGVGDDYVFRNLSPEGGFYYDGVMSIAQDGEGFVWVMMNNDMFRFDGYEYKSYSANLRKNDEKQHWIYHSLQTNRQGELFVCTNNGVFCFDRESDSFEKKFDLTPNFTFDGKDNVWTWEKGRCGTIEADGVFVPPDEKGEIPRTSSVSCSYGEEFYTFGGNTHLYRYNRVKREFRTYHILPRNTNSIRQAAVDGDDMWIMVDQFGFYRVDMKTHTVTDSIDIFARDRISPRSFGIDPNGLLWSGAIDGLYIIDPQTKKHTVYRQTNDEPSGLPNNSIWTIQRDRLDNMWIGTYAGGLCYINTAQSHPFSAYRPREGKLNRAPVSSFAEDGKYLWIGTEGGGLNRMDKKTGKFHYLQEDNEKSNAIAYNNVKSIVVDHRGRLWLGMFTGGLDCYEYDPARRTETVTHYTYSPHEERSLLRKDLRKIVSEPDSSGLWILYQYPRSVVSFFSYDERKCTHFTIDDQQEHYLFDMARGEGDRLWLVGSGYLYGMNTDDKNVEKITLDSTRYIYAQTLCADNRGNVWIGTAGNGLYRYDPREKSCVHIGEIGTVGRASVYSICPDGEGNLWIGTNKGLFRYEPDSGSFLRFDENDGVHGEVYYPLASFRGSDGKLYFGGTTGFTVVEPWKLATNTYRPKVIISQFYIDNIPARIRMSKSGRSGETELVLDHHKANFGFRFSADNYLMPQKNLFRYRLKGYDDRWILADASTRTAMYSKVPPGVYYFEVMAANNDGVWNEVPTVIKIRRKAAPWAGTVACVFYTLIGLVVLGVILYHYNDRKKLRIQLYKEELEKEKKEELHQSQLRFFTNISHDFRTPLSLIGATVGRLREEGGRGYYVRILESNAKRLLNLVNELMDFRTIETGNMKLKPTRGNVSRLFRIVAGDFVEYANQKQVEFRVNIDRSLPDDLVTDRNVVEKVIINLLQNAFKYTREGGCVTLEVFSSDRKFVSRYVTGFTVGEESLSRQTLSIVVSDTGVGIAGESIASVFERFYKVNTVDHDSHLGTGIGLALVKSLVLLHEGKISIYSERGKGTDIVVELPADPDFYRAQGFLLDDRHEETEAVSPDLAPPNALTDAPQDILPRIRKKILLAEDNEDFRRLVGESLSAEYEVLEAADGEEAGELLLKNDIDLVICDILMPRKDGIEFCREVKANVETSHIPFILITAHIDLENNRLQGADSGADVYFEKPLDLELLRLSVQNIFHHRQQLKERYAQNYYADSGELAQNHQDNDFLRRFVDLIEQTMTRSDMSMGMLTAEMHMSRSKLYNKVKKLTDKSPIEFIQHYRMKKAARMIIETSMSMREVMTEVGIESPAYFTNSFKREFGMTPTAFATAHKTAKNR